MLRKLLAKLKGKGRQHPSSTQASTQITGKFQQDERALREKFKGCNDVKFKKMNIPSMNRRQALLIYVEGLVNIDALQRDIISRLLTKNKRVEDINELISAGETKTSRSIDESAPEILLGKVAILVAGIPNLLTVESKEWPMRSIEEPLQERLIRGPREGFTEVIHVNVALVRRRLPDPMLKVKFTTVGRRSHTKVSIMYIEDVCNMKTVGEIEERVNAIDIDGILDPGALAELITERNVSPFPLFASTERPDKVVGGLLQGKVAIISDGSPFAMLAPSAAEDFFQTPEDYYLHPLLATTGRLMRLGGLFMGTTLVAAFTAVISYHYEILPSNIVIFVAATREPVPFSPLTEALLLEFAVELLREASIRLPGPIGPTLSIVGALILGQAAVSARLISPVMLIFVAVSFIGGSIIPNYEEVAVARWLRIPILLAAGFLGGFGIVVTWMVILAHLCNLQSFGVPYMTPLAPLTISAMGDFVYRKPWRWMRERPGVLAKKNITRQRGVEEDENRD